MINGDRLRERLRAVGIRQRDLAKALGLTEAAVSRYAHGGRHPRPELMMRFCTILETSPEYLCGIDGTMDPDDAYRSAMGLIQSYGHEWSYEQRLRLVCSAADGLSKKDDQKRS